jgi:hypothetical protein
VSGILCRSGTLESHWDILAACDFFSVERLVKGKLVRCMVLFAIKLSTRQVELLGIRPTPAGTWTEQIARHMTSYKGFLPGHRYLIHDRDPVLTQKFDSILRAAGVEPVKLPPQSTKETRARSSALNVWADYGNLITARPPDMATRRGLGEDSAR